MFEYIQLEDFTYHILRNEDEINQFLEKWLKQEWEQDHKEDPDQPWTVEWLKTLEPPHFSLEIVDLEKIKPRQDLMEYTKDAYSFIDELNERVIDREESMLRGASIEPVVISANMELMDGYTRYMVLKKHKQKKIYAYVSG